MHALTTERILTGMFLGKQGENYMIKDNQKSLNRFHVVLDAFVTAFSYLLAWFIVIGSGWANLLGKRTLEVGFYLARSLSLFRRICFCTPFWTVHAEACTRTQK